MTAFDFRQLIPVEPITTETSGLLIQEALCFLLAVEFQQAVDRIPKVTAAGARKAARDPAGLDSDQLTELNEWIKGGSGPLFA